ncbi:Uncharacterised protein [Klebsiella pneumoniae]|nr:Uncharacterised protein [Klebsiella pneumoniae]VAN35674.1 Uncharacterised protein [Klebsiella pneumoniae]VAN55494.1 Uncharacterised protein [Klebsiella pneumoniae]VAN71806.1 Uncharacterised protein [Klebsiella pneumoniae]VAN85245.1 Uncharacterised protein [Klebsiella pneumoniae]
MGIIIRLLYGSLPCIPALTYRRDHFCFPGRSYFADKDKVNFAASHCIHESSDHTATVMGMFYKDNVPALVKKRLK